MVHPLALSCDRHKKGKSRKKVSAKQAQLIPCTVVLDDKKGRTWLPGDRLRWLHMRSIVLGHSIDLTHESMKGNAR